VVRVLVLMTFPSGLSFKSPWVQTIFWGQFADEVGVLLDSCRGGALHKSEVYSTGVGRVPLHKNNKIRQIKILVDKTKLYFSNYNPQNFCPTVAILVLIFSVKILQCY
jgi:hypothetical protein